VNKRGLKYKTHKALVLAILMAIPYYSFATSASILQTNANNSLVIISQYTTPITNHTEKTFQSNQQQQQQQQDLVINKPIISCFSSILASASISSNIITIDNSDISNLKPQIIGKALAYPNPMSFNQGSGGVIAYKLSKSTDVILKVFNISGNLIYENSYPEGSNGGIGGTNTYNEVPFSMSEIGDNLPCGIYFFILMTDNEVIGKSKIAITS
jgi:hypothetical protein